MKNEVFEYLKINPRVIVGEKTQYDPINDIIYLKPFDNPIDSAFRFAHEARHAYQQKYNKKILKNYRPREEFNDTNTYNLQEAEVDANAFASYFIDLLCEGKIKITFDSFNEEVKSKIEARKKRGF